MKPHLIEAYSWRLCPFCLRPSKKLKFSAHDTARVPAVRPDGLRLHFAPLYQRDRRHRGRQHRTPPPHPSHSILCLAAAAAGTAPQHERAQPARVQCLPVLGDAAVQARLHQGHGRARAGPHESRDAGDEAVRPLVPGTRPSSGRATREPSCRGRRSSATTAAGTRPSSGRATRGPRCRRLDTSGSRCLPIIRSGRAGLLACRGFLWGNILILLLRRRWSCRCTIIGSVGGCFVAGESRVQVMWCEYSSESGRTASGG